MARIQSYFTSLMMMIAHPFGIGGGNYGDMYLKYAEKRISSYARFDESKSSSGRLCIRTCSQFICTNRCRVWDNNNDFVL